jgi:predicted NBD/HSP70 family sugar kinase
MNDAIWGIDLGGTKIEGVVLDASQKTHPIIRHRIDTEAEKGYEHVLGQISSLVETMKRKSSRSPERIGFATPGVIDPVLQGMKNCNSTHLNGKPLKDDLENILGVPVELANDANCFALAEARWGIVNQVLPGARMVFGIIMGTGVGGGIVINGQVWNGHHGIGGEWGHNFLDESGGMCYCGKVGCVETVLSGPGLQKYYTTLTGEKIRLQEIVSRHYKGEPAAVKTMDRLIYFFGKAIAVVTNILDPDAIVVGGGVGNIDLIYEKGPQSLQNFIFNNSVDVKILKPSLGDSAGVFGAAALVDN